MNTEINVGDVVEVVEGSLQYTAYQKWADAHNMGEYQSSEDGLVKIGGDYKVIAKGSHFKWGHLVLLGIENDKGEQFIISIEGVKKIEAAMELPEKFILKDEDDVWLTTLVDGEYYYEHTVSKYSYGPYSKDKIIAWVAGGNFTIEPIEETNGTDAEGKPLHFTKDMLKPFMRVTAEIGGEIELTETFEYIVVEHNGEKILARNGGWCKIDYPEVRILEVYHSPDHSEVLNPSVKGSLIWKAYASGGVIPNIENSVEDNSSEPTGNFEQRLKHIEEALAGLETFRVNNIYVDVSCDLDAENIQRGVIDTLKRHRYI